MFRRTASVAGALVLTGLLAACSTGPTGSAASSGPTATSPVSSAATKESPAPADFPVTIKNAFGTTTIPERPERVATVSWVNDDVAIALGVVPVGMPAIEWGGNKNRSTPWKDAALTKLGAGPGSDAYPAQYSETDGINYDAIAQLTPDVILAAYSGLDKQSYDKLSKIAPVVAYPHQPYGTSWQTSTRMIGKALGKTEQAEKLIQHTNQLIKKAAQQHPALAGKTFVYGNLEAAGASQLNVYTALDNRAKLLTALGLRLAPVVKKHSRDTDKFFVPWSPERANELKSDVFVSWAPKEITRHTLKSDPLLSQIPAVKSGAFVLQHNETLTLAISASSPLSLEWALNKFVPKLAHAAKQARD